MSASPAAAGGFILRSFVLPVHGPPSLVISWIKPQGPGQRHSLPVFPGRSAHFFLFPGLGASGAGVPFLEEADYTLNFLFFWLAECFAGNELAPHFCRGVSAVFGLFCRLVLLVEAQM